MNESEKAVARASTAVKAYIDAGAWGSYDEILGDLLADLMHYVDALIVDREIEGEFDHLIGIATMHYQAEVNGEE